MDKKNKILFFLPNLNGGGAERVTINLIRQLDSSKYDIFLVLVDNIGVYKNLIPDCVQLHVLDAKKTIYSILKLRYKILELQPHIVYSTLFRTHIALYLALLGIKVKPIIVLRSPNSPKLLKMNNELSLVYEKLLNMAYNWADIIIAQTPEMKDELVEYHRISSLDKIIIFLNPIDKELIDKQVQLDNTKFSKDYINIVAIGRLSRQKGFDILIQAFKLVILKNNNFRLHILGEDSGEKSNLLKQIHNLDLNEYVKLYGFQSNPYSFITSADAYVLSSRWEGLPNTILEALYLQKPIIATKCIPFIESLIKNYQNGILVDVDNYLELSKAILDYQKINIYWKPTIQFEKNVNELFDSILSIRY